MKTIKNYFVSIFLVIAMPLGTALAQNAFPSTESAAVGTADASGVPGATSGKEVSGDASAYNAPPPVNFTVTIPVQWQTQIVRVDYENESIFSLKTGDEAFAFLFSVTKVTDDEWMKVKDQVKEYRIIENKDGFITFVQKVDVSKVKGPADAQYHLVLGQVDSMIESIRVN